MTQEEVDTFFSKIKSKRERQVERGEVRASELNKIMNEKGKVSQLSLF